MTVGYLGRTPNLRTRVGADFQVDVASLPNPAEHRYDMRPCIRPRDLAGVSARTDSHLLPRVPMFVCVRGCRRSPSPVDVLAEGEEGTASSDATRLHRDAQLLLDFNAARKRTLDL